MADERVTAPRSTVPIGTKLPIRFVEDIGENHTVAKPGDAEWSIDHAHLLFMCPCGGGHLSGVPVNRPAGLLSWQWNGNKEKPSLTPSIHNINCGWHGYLTDGEFVTV